MTRMYTVFFTDIAVTAVQDFFMVGPATNKPCRIAGLFLSQNSDLGDAAEEILSVSIIRITGTTAVGSGGASVTPTLVDATGNAAGFTARRNDTTVATGTLTTVMPYQWNIRAGLELWFPPECRPEGVMGDTTGEPGIVVRLNTAPADSLTMSGCLFVEEEG